VLLCLDLVHHYSLNVNTPLLSNGLTIFLCSCLSGNPDLVSALLADLTQASDRGETALYLAIYGVVHRLEDHLVTWAEAEECPETEFPKPAPCSRPPVFHPPPCRRRTGSARGPGAGGSGAETFIIAEFRPLHQL
jgi:hypothetical protein